MRKSDRSHLANLVVFWMGEYPCSQGWPGQPHFAEKCIKHLANIFWAFWHSVPKSPVNSRRACSWHRIYGFN